MAGEDSRINQLTTGAIDRTKVFPFQAASGDVDPVNNTLQALKEDIVPYSVVQLTLTYLGAGVTVNVLNSDFGDDVTFTADKAFDGILGIYASESIFTSIGKVMFITSSVGSATNAHFTVGSYFNTTTSYIYFTKYDGTLLGPPNVSNFFVEIRIYP